MTSPPTVRHRRAANLNPLPRLLSIEQARFELGISRTILYELIGTEKLKSIKIGRRRVIPCEAIDEFIAGLSR
jgi:excisionase family DNA binding protein